MKRLICISFGALMVAAVLVPLPGTPGLADGDTEVSQCFVCHTTPARLIPAIRELVRANKQLDKELPGVTEETEGEG